MNIWLNFLMNCKKNISSHGWNSVMKKERVLKLLCEHKGQISYQL